MAITKKNKERFEFKGQNNWVDIHISVSARKAMLISALAFVLILLILIAAFNPEMRTSVAETILAVINAFASVFSAHHK